MPGIFDRLQQKIEDRKKGTGITPLDLAELSPELRRVMRLMLRELELNYLDLVDAVEDMGREESMSMAELESALNVLVEKQWLIQIGEGKQATYKVNLKRRSASALPTGIWSTLDAKLKSGTK